jgi:hypothetical protein
LTRKIRRKAVGRKLFLEHEIHNPYIFIIRTKERIGMKGEQLEEYVRADLISGEKK